MGAGMAANLLKARHELTVYNRTRAKAAALVALGAREGATIAEAADGDAVFTMLADDRAVESVVFGAGGIIESLPAGAIHISSSTISVALAERLAEAHAQAGQHFVAAPVFGRPDAADAGNLFVVAAGARRPCKPRPRFWTRSARRRLVVSRRPRPPISSSSAAISCLAASSSSLGEAIALVGKGGVDARQYVEDPTSTLFGAPAYEIYGTLIADGKFTPAGFAAPLGHTDYPARTRRGRGSARTYADRRLAARPLPDPFAHGGDALDWSAIGALAAEDAGTAKAV